MKKAIVLIGMILMVIPALAVAQDQWGFSQGDWAVGLQGSGSSDNDVDNTTLSIEASVGYFLSNSLEAGIRQGIGYADIQDGSDIWNGSTRGYLDYNFDLNRWRPFLGVNLGYLYGDNVNETWIAGPEGGLKYFLAPEAFLLALVEYNFTFDDADQADDAFDDGRFVYSLGFGIRF